MAEQKDIFLSTVVPIMDKVRDDLSRKQAAEYGRHASSFGAVMAGAAGPDGPWKLCHQRSASRGPWK